jgi:hypothetical protein
MVEVTIRTFANVVVYPVFLRCGVVVKDGEIGASLFELVEIILGGLHCLVNPKYIGRETVELLLVIEADKPKCPVLYLDDVGRVIDIYLAEQPHVGKYELEILPYGSIEPSAFLTRQDNTLSLVGVESHEDEELDA